MGLTTHVLDTMHGTPAAGMDYELWALDAAGAPQRRIASGCTTVDGRAQGGPLIADGSLVPGRYRLVFGVASYFRARGVDVPDPPFLDVVTLDFGVADAKKHYHVPLLVSPWSYSTYRGS
jgi:5-hydroxyisourate hydrolase